MAEFSDCMKQFNRMCKYYCLDHRHDKCPMYPACNISQCRKIAFERPREFEGKVMLWAREHPVPKYPSWEEYLCSIGFCTYNSLSDPIPADIAEKLGLSPKEANP